MSAALALPSTGTVTMFSTPGVATAAGSRPRWTAATNPSIAEVRLRLA